MILCDEALYSVTQLFISKYAVTTQSATQYLQSGYKNVAWHKKGHLPQAKKMPKPLIHK